MMCQCYLLIAIYVYFNLNQSATRSGATSTFLRGDFRFFCHTKKFAQRENFLPIIVAYNAEEEMVSAVPIGPAGEKIF